MKAALLEKRIFFGKKSGHTRSQIKTTGPIRISRAMLGDSNCFTTSGHPGDLGLFGSIWAVLGHFEPLLSKIWLPKVALKILSKTFFGIHSMCIYKEIYLFNIKRESAD